MGAGKYRHRITISNPPSDSERSAYGGRKGSGSTVATVWAMKQDKGGSESVERGAEYSSGQTVFVIRHRTDVLPKMVITEGSHTYDILSVSDRNGLLKETEIVCKEKIA